MQILTVALAAAAVAFVLLAGPIVDTVGAAENNATLTGENSTAEDYGISTEDAKSTWESITSDNDGYYGVDLNKYHNRIAPNNRGEGIDIVVIDSGFDTDHPLYNPVKDGEPHRDYHVNVVNTWCDGILGCSADDSNGHGTGVTGVVWQAAPNADYYIAKVQGKSDIRKAYNWAHEDINPDVIVSSQGAPGDQTNGNDGNSDLSQAADRAADQDTLVAISAGQTTTDRTWLCEIFDEIDCEEVVIDYPMVPSAAPDALSISSVDVVDSLNTAGYFQFFAPYNSPNNRHNGKPNLAAPGTTVTTFDLGGGTSVKGGSSFASPHVAGVSALLSQSNQADEIKTALESSSINVRGTQLDGDGRVSILGAYDYLNGDNNHPEPEVNIVDKQVGEGSASFRIQLQNNGESSSSVSNGVSIDVANANLNDISLGGFDTCATGSDGLPSCDKVSDIPDSTVELYVDGDSATSGQITVDYTGDSRQSTVDYRGWIYDESDMVINPYPNYGSASKRRGASYERYVSRYPDEDTSAITGPNNPPEYPGSDNPPYQRAAYNETFSVTDYETVSATIASFEPQISSNPSIWDIGAVSEGDMVSTSITLTNEGESQSDISVSSGSGISTSGVPGSVDVGESDSFTATVDAGEYNGGQIQIDYTGGTLRIPIDITVIQSGDITDTETEELSDEAFCHPFADLWNRDDPPEDCDSSTRDWSDTLDLGYEERTGLTEAELTIEYSTTDISIAPSPITVEVNGDEIGQIEASDYDERGEWKTKTFTLDTSLLSSDNTIKMSTGHNTDWDIGSIYDNDIGSDGDTKITYTYREEADIDLDAEPSSVTAEQGDTFTIQATAENDGGRTLDDGLFQVSDYDSSKLNLRDQDSVNLGEIEPGQVTTRSWTFEYQSEEPTTVEFYASGVADETATQDRESVSIMPPNDPPVINSFSSPSEAHPNSEVSYTATVSDPDGDEVDVTLEVYLPSENRWETYGTRTVSGSGTAEFSPSPFGADDIGEDARYRFEYQDGFENSGTWGPFTGPVIANPNTESPSFSDWSYPTEVEPTEDADVSVEITDPNGVESASIEYTYPNGTQKQKQMSQSGTTWSATIPALRLPLAYPADDSPTDVISFSISATDGSQFPKSSDSTTRYIQVQEDTNPPNYQLVSLNRSEIAVSEDEASVDIQVEVKNTGGQGTQDLQLDIIDDQTGNVVHSVTRQDVTLQDSTNDIERNVINPDPQSPVTFEDVSITDLEPGNYTYTISSENDTISGSLTISMSDGSPPEASFTYTPTSPTVSESVAFNASGSSDDGTIQSYDWSFGDGTTATGETVTHSYNDSGSYTVTLTVTDDDGATDTENKTVSVDDGTSGGAVEDIRATLSDTDGDGVDDRIELNVDVSNDGGATVVEFAGPASLDLSSTDQQQAPVVSINDEQPNENVTFGGLGYSGEYTVTGSLSGQSVGDVIDVTAWVGAVSLGEADDTASASYTVGDISAAPAAVSSSDVSIGDVGDTGNSTITVDAENGLSVADVNVSVDTSVARITGVSAGDDVNTGDPAVQFQVTEQTEGLVSIEYTTIDGTGPIDGFEFAEVEFERRSQGNTPIQLETDNWGYLDDSGSPVAYPRVAEDEGRITQAFFVDPIMGEFRGPPQSIPPSQGGFHDRLVEDIDGDGDPTDVGPTVTAFGELIRGNDLGLSDAQARKLNWNEDSPATEVTVADMVTLFGEKIRSD